MLGSIHRRHQRANCFAEWQRRISDMGIILMGTSSEVAADRTPLQMIPGVLADVLCVQIQFVLQVLDFFVCRTSSHICRISEFPGFPLFGDPMSVELPALFYHGARF